MRISTVTLLVPCAIALSASSAQAADPSKETREYGVSQPSGDAPPAFQNRAVLSRRELKLDLGLPPSAWAWATPRAHVASIGPVGALPLYPRFWGGGGGGGPLRVTGGVVFGLGLATLFGAGVTAIVAAAQTSRLSDDCPGKICYEGTSGGRALNTARDAAQAADWLIGIGAPVTASGMLMMLYSIVVERADARLAPSPVFRASPNGLIFQF